ncbi:hypothetical protein [uncultured Dokdonia sp.]|uniref:hypothetical protein n=1 Tax=uncultured Dokdonia sp. TaxID=575653 RepID=UPI002611CBA5|nr:hypothetical protein [uncultured Dokdonia sp.]
MQTLFKINKVIMIINAILFIIPYFGLLFMIITGISQLTLFLIYVSKWKLIATELKKYFISYGIVASISVGLLIISNKFSNGQDALMIISMLLGGILSLCFLYLSKKQSTYSNHIHIKHIYS